jgi:hypothetical protein
MELLRCLGYKNTAVIYGGTFLSWAKIWPQMSVVLAIAFIWGNVIKQYHGNLPPFHGYYHSSIIYKTELWYVHGIAVYYFGKKFYNIDTRCPRFNFLHIYLQMLITS